MTHEIKIMVRVSGKYGYEIYEDGRPAPVERSRYIYGSYETAHAAGERRLPHWAEKTREVQK